MLKKFLNGFKDSLALSRRAEELERDKREREEAFSETYIALCRISVTSSPFMCRKIADETISHLDINYDWVVKK